MPKFPVDAPKARVIAALGVIGFAGSARRESHLHAATDRGQTGLTAKFRQRAPEIHVRLVCPLGGPDCLTMPNHSTIKASTLRTVLNQAGITRAEFLDAYEQA